MKNSSHVTGRHGNSISALIFYENEIKELVNERAALAFRYSAIEAVHSIREQEKQVQLKVLFAMTKNKLEGNYADTFAKLREEFQRVGCQFVRVQPVANGQL